MKSLLLRLDEVVYRTSSSVCQTTYDRRNRATNAYFGDEETDGRRPSYIVVVVVVLSVVVSNRSAVFRTVVRLMIVSLLRHLPRFTSSYAARILPHRYF